ncbi:unnamed protein product [Diatraea saccharalis]|uniref:Uncharacterized protein n=1 Tax=Diatraea saccharalis TaxID=40085 RepID=A0A9N9QY07_9NEOP|nr:unnamed protein product [Diatraea saccharalis]
MTELAGIYPVNPNALPDAEFAISDIALRELAQERESDSLNNQAPGISGVSAVCEGVVGFEPDSGLAIYQRNKAPLLSDQVTSYADKSKLEPVLNETEQNSVSQDHTPPRPSPSLLNLSQDCLALADSDIEKYILDGTEPSFPSLISLNDSHNQNLEKETPSKFLHQSSPIPVIPLSMSKRAKQSAEILNSKNKILQKKNKKENLKTNYITVTKKTTAKKKDFKAVKHKLPGSKKSIVKKTENPKKNKKAKKCIDITSSETESENTNFIELSKERVLIKRKIQIYSSDSENEENVMSPKTSKGKATEGLPIKRIKDKKSTKDTVKILKVDNTNSNMKNRNEKVSVDDYCVECFKNYNFTKSISDWIQCEMCRMWLHESCTTFTNHCMRCGKLKALAYDDN